MKNNSLIIALIIVLGIIVLALSVFLVFALSNTNITNSFNWSKTEYQNVIYNKTYENVFSNININSDAANIFIKNSTTSETKVIINGKEENLAISDQDTLDIKLSEQKIKWFIFNYKTARIEIYLPEDYSGEININNKYGDIEIEDFVNANITIKSAYGDTNVDRAKELNVESSAGDIKVNEVERITADNNLGDIKISLVKAYLDINADCGDIKIDEVNLTENSQIKDSLGSIKIRHTNDIRIDARTDLGDSKIYDNNYKSDIVLIIKNSCGDIKVNN